MAERCRYAYRKRGKNAVFCKNIPDKNMDYCLKQVPCKQTGRWEAAECLVDHCDWFEPEEMLRAIQENEQVEATPEEEPAAPAPKKKSKKQS